MAAKFLSPKSNQGFTLLEVLLTIAIIGILAGAAAPVFQALQNRNDLDIALTTTAQSLRRAQLLAQAVANDTTWGVKVRPGFIIIFQGPNFINRNTNFDEEFTMSSSLTFSGVSEFVFSKFSGLPQNPGTLILTTTNNESKSLNLNAKGTISY